MCWRLACAMPRILMSRYFCAAARSCLPVPTWSHPIHCGPGGIGGVCAGSIRGPRHHRSRSYLNVLAPESRIARHVVGDTLAAGDDPIGERIQLAHRQSLNLSSERPWLTRLSETVVPMLKIKRVGVPDSKRASSAIRLTLSLSDNSVAGRLFRKYRATAIRHAFVWREPRSTTSILPGTAVIRGP
jgi:hypothetical protein